MPALDPTDRRRRVVVVDDSIVQRRFLRAVIAADPQLSLVGEAGDGLSAVSMVERLAPDVVLMDLHLPKLDGVEAIARLMAARPTPVIVYSAFVSQDAGERQAALAAGAADVLPKPGPRDGGRLEEYADELRARLRAVGSSIAPRPPRSRRPVPDAGHAPHVPVAGRPAGSLSRPSAPPPAYPAAPGVDPVRAAGRVPVPAAAPAAPGRATVRAAAPPSPDPLPPPRPRRPTPSVVAIGASTGGPAALGTVLGGLPAGFPAAILVVQHMAEGFIDGLAEWLDGVCPLPVSVAVSGRRLEPGTVVVAPNRFNVVLDDDIVVRTEPPSENQYHVPGIDAAFISVAHRIGSRSVGVLLTGMGRDGALGLRALHDRGAYTIAQDAASCAVYGMPAAAVALGAVDQQLPLADVAPALRRLVPVARPAVTP